MAERAVNAEPAPTGMMMDAKDADGNVLTIYSTTGNPQTQAVYNAALQQYAETGKDPANFVVLKQGSLGHWFREKFEAVNRTVQPALENIGQKTAENLAFFGRGQSNPVVSQEEIQPVRDIGRQAGRYVGSVVDTPGKAGATAAIAAAAPLMAPITGATGAMRALPLVTNMLKSGAMGATGYATGNVLGGESVTPGVIAEQFGIAALAGGLKSVLGHFVTRFIGGDRVDKVAKDIVNAVADEHPNVKLDPGLINIAGSGPADVARMTQRGVEGLRGTVDDVSAQFAKDIKSVLPTGLTKEQNALLQQQLRNVVRTQNRMLDNINDPQKYAAIREELIGSVNQETGVAIPGKLQELTNTVKSLFPKLKSTLPMEGRINTVIAQYGEEVQHLQQGAQVLSYIREASGNEGFNPQKFADLIRGVYQRPGNPLLERVGNILGGGRPLTEMPQRAAENLSPAQRATQEVLGYVKRQIPGLRHIPGVSPQQAVPWPTPGNSMPLPGSIAIMEGVENTLQPLHQSENAEAMKRFMRR